MTRLFDEWGWATNDPQFAGRSASKEVDIPEEDPSEGDLHPNWTGTDWVMMPYVVPPAPAPVPEPEPEPEPVWAWYIDIGPFTDRLGLASASIDLSTDPGVIVIRNDLARRDWVDLKDMRVVMALRYLAGQSHPVLGTLSPALLSMATVDAVLSTPVTPEENLALRKLYFS